MKSAHRNPAHRREPTDVSCQLCSQNHNTGRCPQILGKMSVRPTGLCEEVQSLPKLRKSSRKGLCQSETRCLVDGCIGFHHSTLHRTDARQQQQNAQPSGNWTEISQNSIFWNQTNQNQSNYGPNFNNENQMQQTSSNYKQQNGNQNRQIRSNSSSLHRGNWNKNGFHSQPMNTQSNNNNRQQNTIQPNSRQRLCNKTTFASSNRELLRSDRRYSFRWYQ